ncbi:alpha/beta hydrolase [Shewanella mangrovisoli]|uniref:alpha/beta hydrolase n=1 Tax=Shewanella mangrovisoli TaxID=2864211 RepID=UPI0035B8487A
MATLLIVPGFGGSGPLHWQSWIAQKYESTIWVNDLPLLEPKIHIWANAICHTIDQIEGEILILAHSFGCLASSLAIARHPQRVAAAILVAPASPARFSENGHILPEHDGTQTIKHLLPTQPLGVTGLVIASENDPWMPFNQAAKLAKNFGFPTINLGLSGHINVDSGHGPWPLIDVLIGNLIYQIESAAEIQANELANFKHTKDTLIT